MHSSVRAARLLDCSAATAQVLRSEDSCDGHRNGHDDNDAADDDADADNNFNNK